MTVAAQSQLPGAGKQTLKEWLSEWLDRQYPNRATFDREEAREDSFAELPYRYVPTQRDANRAWYTAAFNRIAKELGFAFEEGREGRQVSYQLEMSFPDFAALCVGQLILTREDQDAIRRRLEDYAAAHPTLVPNVDATWSSWRQAAGLAS